jgi:hypothetical protein
MNWLAKLAFWCGLGAAAHLLLKERVMQELPCPIARYTVLDETFPAALHDLIVAYITTWGKDPRLILAGRKEYQFLRSYPHTYVLSVDVGGRWYFQSVLILPVALDSYLDVVG